MSLQENTKKGSRKPFGVVKVTGLPIWDVSPAQVGICEFVIYDLPVIRANIETLKKLDGLPLSNAIRFLVDVGECHMNSVRVHEKRLAMVQSFGLMLLDAGQNRFVTISNWEKNVDINRANTIWHQCGKRGHFAKSGDYVACSFQTLEDGLREWPDLRFSGVPRIKRQRGLYFQIDDSGPIAFLQGDRFIPVRRDLPSENEDA